MKRVIVAVIIFAIFSSMLSVGQPGTPYTLFGWVYLNGSPFQGATVNVTNTRTGDCLTDITDSDGFYSVNLGNYPNGWHYGDVIIVEAFYNEYYGKNTTVLTQGVGDFAVVNVTMRTNSPPSITLLSPSNGSTGISLNPVLSVEVSDADGDLMNVSFYNVSNGLIGTVSNVASGSNASITWNDLSYNTTYSWYVVVSDGIVSVTSPIWHFTTKENTPPNKPSISGPSSGYVGVSYTFSASTTDAGGDKVKYGWDWDNDSIVDEWSGWYSSGATCSVTHSWSSEGVYSIKVKAQDEYGMESDWSNVLQITITTYIPPNTPPNVEITSPLNGSVVNGTVIIQGKAWDEDGNSTIQKVEVRIDNGTWNTATGTNSWSYEWNTTAYENGPHVIYARSYDGGNYSVIAQVNVTVDNNIAPAKPNISGATKGYTNISYQFNASSTDENGDKIKYGFDWNNDSIVDEWTNYYESGIIASLNHSWNKAGIYGVKVIAEDERGMQSEWSEILYVNITQYDNIPPTCYYEFGSPNTNLTYNGVNYTTIKICTPLWINATDNKGIAWLNYSIWWNASQPTNFTKLYDVNVQDNDENDTDKRVGFISVVLHFNEECFHEIKWNATDYNGNCRHFNLTIAVDATAPNITKEIGEPKYIEGNITWVNCHTPIWINVTDDGCGGGVGVWKATINIYWNETGEDGSYELLDTLIIEDNDENDTNLGRGEISYLLQFSEGCLHEIEVIAEDYVGNNFMTEEKYMVDCLPPSSKVEEIPYNQTEAIINITVADIADYGCNNGVGVNKVEVYYAYSTDGENFGEWQLYAVNNSLITHPDGISDWHLTFTASQIGWYRFISIAYDCVGNVEDFVAYDAECYVNLSISISFGKPKYGEWISLTTPINITASNPGNIYYRIYNNKSWHPSPGSGAGNNGNFYIYTGNFTLGQHSCRHGVCFIEFYGDGTTLMNCSIMLDTSPPLTFVSTPFFVPHPINIECSAYDEGSGISHVEFYYQYSYDNKSWSNWSFGNVDYFAPYQWNFSMDIGFYRICSIAVDNVENEEDIVSKDSIRVFTPDFNEDGIVNVQDLVILAVNFGISDAKYDIDGNGKADVSDVSIILNYWT